MLDIIEDGDEHLVLGHTKCGRIGVIVGTVMDDAIHIQLSMQINNRFESDKG